ncbi:M3 family oligoendopeptidase, partial [Thermotoga sp.]|uniref:M3 family oligoendopeptidase n=1 Tax=Thermotoga sp. TaxID=28240 RepID=UPI0025CE5BA3
MQWKDVEPLVNELLEFHISSSEDFRSFVNRVTDFFDQVEEEHAWLYIRMTVNADKEENAKAYENFQKEVVAKLKPYEQKIKEKIVENERFAPLGYEHMIKILKNDVDLFRKENVPLQVKESILAKNYGTLVGSIEVEFKGEKKTLQQLSAYLRDPDRSTRELAWRKRYEGIWGVREKLNELFDKLKNTRHQQALNADFSNYRDYMHRLKGRFEYTPEDIYRFHESVEKEVVPYLVERTKVRQKKLGIESVKPWDTAVDVDGKVLKPFSSVKDFMEKTERALKRLNPVFADRFRLMKEKGLLDLENRKGKAPGGYNHTLPKTGAPFIFMNAVGQPGDVRTIFHELGHSMHSFETLSLPVFYRPYRMEVAELASMSMELISMEYWDEFYED